MGNPNEPRLMKARGHNGTREPVFGQETGRAGRDGYTVLARREPPRAPSDDSPFGFYPRGDSITPEVGERDYRRGPRFSEDY